MNQPNDISGRAEEIQLLIASCDLRKAGKRLMDFVRDFSSNKDYFHDTIVLIANYNNLETDLRREIIEYDNAQRQKNKLLYKMLDLVELVLDQPIAA